MRTQKEPVLHEVDEPRRHRVELVLGNKPVSRTSVVDVPTRIGTVEVRLGGIGDVFTVKRHRMKGHNGRVIRHCVEWMTTETDYDVSGLFGIWGYYQRFGYVSCMPAGPTFVLGVNSPVRAATSLTVRPLRRSDLPAVLRLYAAENATRTGSAVRNARTWRGFRHGVDHRPTARNAVATDARGRVAGYIVCSRHNKEGWVVAEAAGRDADACRTLLAWSLRAARRSKLERLRLHLAIDSMMADVCRAEGCRIEVGFHKGGGPMARIIHQDSLLRKLAPEFTKRFARSEHTGWTGAVDIETDLGRDRLVVARGRVHCARPGAAPRADIRIRIPQPALTQLVYGYRRAAELLCAHGCRLSSDKTEVIDVLFPVGWAYTWWPDRY